YKNRSDVLILGLPRGGVPVAFEVARELNAPLDVFIVRKLGVPGHEELGMGAIATGGTRILHKQIIQDLGISPNTIDTVTLNEKKELERRENLYLDDPPPLALERRVVIVFGDGLAPRPTIQNAPTP